eukprot:TRINITY_DN182_c0_g2_i1.p1 TRINITY_DN182_c0_g2~~TRINITY_DN182_c0_g2_i1.p1  ORF type:complete len:566 (-),score=123.84 TRINITY_DN182_c0_g2_i1:40-1737(-)
MLAVLASFLASTAAHSVAKVDVTGCWQGPAATQFPRSSFPRCQKVDSTITAYWRLDENLLAVGLDVATVGGWVGFGISANGGMKGADIVIVTKHGDKWKAGDYFSATYDTPVADKHSDVDLLSVVQSNGHTYAAFQRPVEATCGLDDAEEDFDVTSGPTFLIFAYNSDTFALDQHTHHVHTSVMMGGTQEEALTPTHPPLPNTTYTVEVVTPAVDVPTDTTTYMCSLHMLPHDQKYHAYLIEPIMSNHPLLHHMIIYMCDSEPANFTEGAPPQPCHMSGCTAFWQGWAPGVGDSWAPADAAWPIGTTKNTYLRLEIHYNNPEGMSGVVDQSGFRIHYTPELRTHDVGVLMVGPYTNLINIPAGESNFHISNECPTGCTSNKIPADGVRVFGVNLHMHLTGKKAWLQHIRGTTELPLLGDEPYYDFAFQHSVARDVMLMPGDRMIMNCIYDTTERTAPTVGGEGTYNEMCFGFLTYYPYNPDLATYCGDIRPQYDVGLCVPEDVDLFYTVVNRSTSEAIAAGYITLIGNEPAFTPLPPNLCLKSGAATVVPSAILLALAALAALLL